MNISKFTFLINKPDAINDKQTIELERIVQEFPYFQSARALFLKGLYNQNSFKYNHVLKIAAAHTVDRSVLFDFITSDTFTAIQKELYDKNIAAISDIKVSGSEIVEPKLEVRENTIERSILNLIKEAEPKDSKTEEPEKVEISAPEEPVSEKFEQQDTQIQKSEEEIPAELAVEFIPGDHIEENLATAEKLEIGKPLEFSVSEKHSFQEWLQLSSIKPIVREETPVEIKDETISEIDLEKQKKNELIDRFIEASPKIPPVKHNTPLPSSIITEPSNADNSYLMTETLARVYLEQKKYQKAIQAYQILILKYPEKSSFFADRILDIKHLQQNNK